MIPPLSVQLYTVRNSIASDLPGTLERLAQIGYAQVELFDFVDRAAEYSTALARTGLRASSAHAALLSPRLAAILDAAGELDIGTVIEPRVDETRWTSRDDIVAIADELSEVSRKAADRGIAVGYHNHAFELENRVDGTSALEIFADALSADVVLEVDTYWAEVGGEGAAALLRRLGERVRFLHVKDGPINKVNAEQTAVGRGNMPVAEILQAAPDAQRIVELDDFTGDVFTAVEDSFTFLTELEK